VSGSFRISRHGSTWSLSVRLYTFPYGAGGIYRVTWKLGTKPLGPTLRFRLQRVSKPR
jgi:hypothetical protein